MESTLNPAETDEAWKQIAPKLDDAMGDLREIDRNAVLLRFFENRTLAQVGTALGVSEDGARVRVNRALKKLRTSLCEKGVMLNGTLIAGAVIANSTQAAPVMLAKAISVLAVANGTAATNSTLTLVQGVLKIMAWTKIQTAIVVGAGVLLGLGIITSQIRMHGAFNKDIDAYISDVPLEDYKKAPPLLAIQPTHFPNYDGLVGHSGPDDAMGDGLVGRDQTIEDLIATAYDFNTPRIIFPKNIPANHYDFLATVPNQRHAFFQAEIAKVLGYAARKEIRDVDVQVIKVTDSGIGKLKAGRKVQLPEVVLGKRPPGPAFNYPDDPVSVLAEALEYRFSMPVIDQTGLTGNYDMVFDWRWKGDWHGKDRKANLDSLKEVIQNQLGLEIVSTNLPVEMLVVEKVK